MAPGVPEKTLPKPETVRPVYNTEPVNTSLIVPVNDNNPAPQIDQVILPPIFSDFLFKAEEKGAIKIFGFPLFDPAWLAALPQNSPEDPKNDSKHAGDPQWIEGLIKSAETKHQESLQIKKRIEALETKRKEKDDYWGGVEAFEWDYDRKKDDVVQKAELALLDPAQDEKHTFDKLWIPALQLEAEKREQAALEFLKRSKTMIRDQGDHSNLGLMPLFERARILERSMDPKQNRYPDPIYDPYGVKGASIESLMEKAEQAYAQNDFALALRYVERIKYFTAEAIRTKQVSMPVSDLRLLDSRDEYFKASMKYTIDFLNRAGSLEKKTHLAWHGLNDHLEGLEKQINTEIDPVKLDQIKKEIDWVKQGQAKVKELDQMIVTSLPPSFKTSVREKLVQAYLNHDEKAVAALTKKTSEYFPGFEIVSKEEKYVTLRFTREDGTFEDRRVSATVQQTDRMKGSYGGQEGEIEVWTLTKDNGEPMKIWHFFVKDQSGQELRVASQKIEGEAGEVEILKEVAAQEPRQAKIFNKFIGHFPNYSSYIGLTLDFSEGNKTNVRKRITGIERALVAEVPFEVEFTRLGELTVSKEFMALKKDHPDQSAAVERAMAYVFSESTLKSHFESFFEYHYQHDSDIGHSMENHFMLPVTEKMSLKDVARIMAERESDLQTLEAFLAQVDGKIKGEEAKNADPDAVNFEWARQNSKTTLEGFLAADQKIKVLSEKQEEPLEPDDAKKKLEAQKKQLKSEYDAFRTKKTKELEAKKKAYVSNHSADAELLKDDAAWETAFQKGGAWNLAACDDESAMAASYSETPNAMPSVYRRQIHDGTATQLLEKSKNEGWPEYRVVRDWHELETIRSALQNDLSKKIDQISSPDQLKALYGEMKALYGKDLDSGLTELYRHNVEVLRGQGMNADLKKIEKFKTDLDSILTEKDTSKKAGMIQRWQGEMNRYIFILSVDGEKKMAESFKSSGKRFNRWVAWLPGVDEKNIQKIFVPHIEKLNSVKSEFETGEDFLQKAYEAQANGHTALYEDLLSKGQGHIDRAWEIYQSLSQSIQRKILIDEGKSSAKWSGLVIGIGIIAIAAFTAGTATPFLLPEGAGLLATTAVSAGVFTVTHEILNSAVYDDVWILSGERWNSWGKVKSNLWHLAGAYAENFAMFLFIEAFMQKTFGKVMQWRFASKAEEMAIKAGEVIKIGEELVPLAKGGFKDLSKATRELYLNKVLEDLPWLKGKFVGAGREMTNYIALNTWTVVSSPFTGRPANIFTWESQSFTLMFLGGLMPMNYFSGKVMQATLMPHLSKKFEKKLVKELEGMQKDEIAVHVEQLKLTKEGLVRMGMADEAKDIDALLEWFGKDRQGDPPIDPKNALGLNMIMVQRLSSDPKILQHPEWAHWMQKQAEVQIKMGENAKKKSELMEKYPSAFTSQKITQDPSGKWEQTLDATVRKQAKEMAHYADQSRPFYERMSRMIEAHRMVFGPKMPYQPVENLKLPYRAEKGADLIDFLPDLLGADAHHQVLIDVKKNGVINVMLVGLDPNGGDMLIETLFITPKEKVSGDQVAQMRRHVTRAAEKNPYVKSLKVDVVDAVVNVDVMGQAEAKKEASVPNADPPFKPPTVDENTFVPPPPPPPPPPGTYPDLRLDPMVVMDERG